MCFSNKTFRNRNVFLTTTIIPNGYKICMLFAYLILEIKHIKDKF
jgi:hypothetical protein